MEFRLSNDEIDILIEYLLFIREVTYESYKLVSTNKIIKFLGKILFINLEPIN